MITTANVLILLCMIIFPLLWLRSEFVGTRGSRITFGIFSLITCWGVAAIVGLIVSLWTSYHYGEATKQLIEKTVNELEHGNQKMVISELRRLHEKIHPTYEKDYYENYVTETISRMDSKATSDTQEKVTTISRHI